MLSTKILTPPQKELLLNAKVGFVEYDAIKIDFPSIEIPLNFSHYLFTSKNGVRAFIKVIESKNEEIDRKKYICFCVGDKTKQLLEDSGFIVSEIAHNASDLAYILAERHKTNRFIYIAGNLRRNELPEILSKNNVWYREIVAYHTHLVPKQFERNFDGVLFFSPSGVRSYFESGNSSNSIFFCIGKTTAEEAKEHNDQINIANKPTTENVLVQAIKELSFRT